MAIISEQCTDSDKYMTKFKISNNNSCHTMETKPAAD